MAKPIAASTTGHPCSPPNHSPVIETTTSSPTATRPMPSTCRRVGSPDPRRGGLDAGGRGLERGEEPGQQVDDDAETGGE